MEQTVAKGEAAALACYGLLARWWPPGVEPKENVWPRFDDGRPVSGVTTQFLAWSPAQAVAAASRRCCWSGTTPRGI